MHTIVSLDNHPLISFEVKLKYFKGNKGIDQVEKTKTKKPKKNQNRKKMNGGIEMRWHQHNPTFITRPRDSLGKSTFFFFFYRNYEKKKFC